MRRILAVLVLSAFSGLAAAQAYPSRPVTIIMAFPPGGLNDIVTRPLAAAMEPILKQPVVLETKAGAAGQVGAQVAATAKPDGYTLLSHNVGISGYAEVDKLFGRTPKFTNADFIPLARLVADRSRRGPADARRVADGLPRAAARQAALGRPVRGERVRRAVPAHRGGRKIDRAGTGTGLRSLIMGNCCNS